MNYYYPIFGCFLIFIIWLNYERTKTSKQDKKKSANFWQKEQDANSVRRVSLDTLTYISIPDSILLPSLSAKDSDDEVLLKCNEELMALKDKRIFNLTGKTATDIKEAYGPANLSALDEYDSNYTHLVKTIYEFGSRLNELNFEADAIKILEFGIDSLTDISGNYKLLANLYVKNNTKERLDYLLDTAKKLDSLNQKSIIEYVSALK